MSRLLIVDKDANLQSFDVIEMLENGSWDKLIVVLRS